MPASQALLSSAHRAGDDPPLPADDLSAIRLLTLPDVGPPFDDDPAARAVADPQSSRPGGIGPGSGAGGRGHGATGSPAVSAAPGAVGTNPALVAGEVAEAAGRRASGAAGGQADADWAGQFAGLLTEALSGARPVRQILPWTSERARGQLRALMPLFAGGQRPRVLRVITTRPARDVIEMTVIAGMGARARALAVRLERADPARRPAATTVSAAARWVCTDIEAA